MAEASNAPENFIGLHFFSPVDKMQLVEIIVGKNTSDDTLARAFDYVQQIGKIPIVVNDSRGFFTSRVFGTFVNEGICMLGEGIHPASIENAGVLSGMPVGPLAISDEVSLTLMRHIRDQSKKDTEAAGNTWRPHPAEAVIDQMLDQHARKGKAAGAGFYEYPANGKKYLWPELETQFVDAGKARSVALQDLKDRILFIQAIETVRCLEEGVLRTIEDANVGSIFGIGYAPGPVALSNSSTSMACARSPSGPGNWRSSTASDLHRRNCCSTRPRPTPRSPDHPVRGAPPLSLTPTVRRHT